MLRRNWDDFPSTAPKPSGEVMRFEPNGWLAQIAFLAGPAWVYQGPASYEPRISHWDGEAPIYDETTDDDIAAIHEDMTEYLENAGLPEPPFRVEWRLCLPEGVSPGDVRGPAPVQCETLHPRTV